ncbi:MAG: hypothetical protein NTW19_00770 [Planctomycetota bacterium]|nr:hypothetical protein [Planctomycetota bacterium]
MNRLLHHEKSKAQAAVRGLNGAASWAGTAAHSAIDTADHAVAAVRDTLQHSYESGKARSEQVTKDLSKSVAAHPLASVALAAGAGMLVGLLWPRR